MFVKDIIGDVLVWTVTVVSLTYGVATGMTAYWLPLAMLGVSSFFAFFDFLFSLNGGGIETSRNGQDPDLSRSVILSK